jgi:hypothetical protein
MRKRNAKKDRRSHKLNEIAEGQMRGGTMKKIILWTIWNWRNKELRWM